MFKKKQLTIIISLSLSLTLLTSCNFTINIPKNQLNQESQQTLAGDQKISEEEDQQFIDTFLNKEIPDFKMKNLQGELVNIKDIEGPFILDFALVTCPGCIELYPVLEHVTNDGIRVIEVFRKNSKKEIEEMLTENGLKEGSDILSGLEDPDNNNVMEVFKLTAVPTMFFIDSNKIVKHIEIGSLPYEDISNLINEYLN